MKTDWPTRPLSDFVKSKSGNSKIVKGTQSDKPGDGLIQGFSASGPDVWVTTADYNQPGVVISAVGARSGKTFMADGQWTAIANTHVLLPGKDIDSRWLWYRTNDETFWIRGGSAQPFVKVKDTLQQPCKIPPLPEQQRIVGVLDEAFAGLATAQANAGKNLQNARALFASHLQSVFTQRGKGWVEKTFEELIESNVIGLTKNSREQGEDKAWPYVKMNNITRDNRFDFSKFTCVDATDEEVSKFSLRDGDFLFNTRNSYELVGKSCIYETDSNDAVVFNNNIMRVRFKPGIDARFILLTFSSKSVADELTALKSGTTNVSAIYFKDLRSLVIPIPPIAVQKAIAAKLDALSEETQRLAAHYERKLALLAALRKSLLHEAFTGQL